MQLIKKALLLIFHLLTSIHQSKIFVNYLFTFSPKCFHGQVGLKLERSKKIALFQMTLCSTDNSENTKYAFRSYLSYLGWLVLFGNVD